MARRIAASIAKLPELSSRRQRGAMTVGRWLLVFGFGCLAVVVLTHIAEKLNLFPVMGWGLPDSPGHYLDLISAVLGTVLLVAGIIAGVYWRRPR
jgi:hypothetical protein